MLQPDPLSYGGRPRVNRYSYVFNNPLSLTDPTGYSWSSHFLDNATGFLALGPLGYSAFHNEWNSVVTNPYVRMAGAAVAGYFTFGTSYAALGEGFWAGVGAGASAGFVSGAIQSNGNLQGALQGAFSGALFGGIGSYYGNTYSVSRIVVAGAAGGIVSSLEGRGFGNGFLSAGAMAAAGPVIDRLDPWNPRGQTFSAERIVAAAMVGGTVSSVSGGKFANGAGSGAFQQVISDGLAAATNSNRQSLSGNTLARQGMGLLDLAGKIWALPDTAIGLAAGIASLPFGSTISIEHNAIAFNNFPWGPGGALTLGNVILNTEPTLDDVRAGIYNDPQIFECRTA